MLPSLIRRAAGAGHRIDFKKRFDGLLGAAYCLGADPYAGDCVVFLKGDHTQLRALAGLIMTPNVQVAVLPLGPRWFGGKGAVLIVKA
jgi:hypothetical protein